MQYTLMPLIREQIEEVVRVKSFTAVEEEQPTGSARPLPGTPERRGMSGMSGDEPPTDLVELEYFIDDDTAAADDALNGADAAAHQEATATRRRHAYEQLRAGLSALDGVQRVRGTAFNAFQASPRPTPAAGGLRSSPTARGSPSARFSKTPSPPAAPRNPRLSPPAAIALPPSMNANAPVNGAAAPIAGGVARPALRIDVQEMILEVPMGDTTGSSMRHAPLCGGSPLMARHVASPASSPASGSLTSGSWSNAPAPADGPLLFEASHILGLGGGGGSADERKAHHPRSPPGPAPPPAPPSAPDSHNDSYAASPMASVTASAMASAMASPQSSPSKPLSYRNAYGLNYSPPPSMISLSLDHSPWSQLCAEDAVAIADAHTRDEEAEARAEAAADAAAADEDLAASFFAFGAPRYARGASLTQPPSPDRLGGGWRAADRSERSSGNRSSGERWSGEGISTDAEATDVLGVPSGAHATPLPMMRTASMPPGGEETGRPRRTTMLPTTKLERRRKVVHRRVRSFDDVGKLLDELS